MRTHSLELVPDLSHAQSSAVPPPPVAAAGATSALLHLYFRASSQALPTKHWFSTHCGCVSKQLASAPATTSSQKSNCDSSFSISWHSATLSPESVSERLFKSASCGLAMLAVRCASLGKVGARRCWLPKRFCARAALVSSLVSVCEIVQTRHSATPLTGPEGTQC